MFKPRDIKNTLTTTPTDEQEEEFEKASQQQYIKELGFLVQYNPCQELATTNEKFVQHINQISPSNLKDFNDKQFFNSKVINTDSCLVTSLTSISSDWKFYIDSHFVNLKQIGPSSSNGVALLSDFNTNNKIANSLFVIKTVQDSENSETLVHEAVIGLKFLNKLREYIPNFACVYGFFNCGITRVAPDGKVKKWCDDTGDQNNYIVYENITNSQSMTDLLATDLKNAAKNKQAGNNNYSLLTADTYFQLFMQFLLALRTANKWCNFTHYDCHTGNTLLKKLDKKSIIRFPMEFEKDTKYIYMETDTILIKKSF